jgi:hypothetical protein
MEDGVAMESAPPADGSVASSSYDNLTDDSQVAGCASSGGRPDESANASCIVVKGDENRLDKSCDSITTLQEVLEDYESVMSGKHIM